MSLMTLTVAFFLSACAAMAPEVPEVILQIEDARVLDSAALAACEEALPGSAPIIAAKNSTAGAIREIYANNAIINPDSAEYLPAEEETYAAICIFDGAGLNESPYDRAAYWVSEDQNTGGAVSLALWNLQDVHSTVRNSESAPSPLKARLLKS
jgi:hypothetical protein